MLGWLEVFGVCMVLILLGYDVLALFWLMFARLSNIPEESAGVFALILFFILIVRKLWGLGDVPAKGGDSK